MSDFDYQPAYGLQVKKQPKVHIARFEEGYEQRTAAGINNKLRMWNLTFSRVTADIDAIETFLDGKGGTTTFTWTPSGESEVTVICREWNINYNSNNTRQLSCAFEEVAG
jgi:phage-related protein